MPALVSQANVSTPAAQPPPTLMLIKRLTASVPPNRSEAACFASTLMPDGVRRPGRCSPFRDLPGARFGVLRTTVHRRPPASVACTNTIWANIGERWRTGVNETNTETTG